VTVADPSHPVRGVAPRLRRRTPAAPSHPGCAVAPRPRCRTPAALSHPGRGAAHLVVLPHLPGGV